MTSTARARTLAVTTAAVTAVALLPLVPAVAEPAAPPAERSTLQARTLRGAWTVSGPGVPDGVVVRFRGRRGGSVEITAHPCDGGETVLGATKAWEWAPEGLLVVARPSSRGLGCAWTKEHAAWLLQAERVVPTADGGRDLLDRDRRRLASLAPRGPRAGRLQGRPRWSRPARPAPDGVRPAGRRALVGTWLAVGADGRVRDRRPVARVRPDGTARIAIACGRGDYRWAVHPRSGALVTASASYGATGCAAPESPRDRRHLAAAEAFARAERAGRDGRLLVLTGRKGRVIGRYVRA